MNLQIQNSFQIALKYPNPVERLRSVVENLVMEGYETTGLLAELEWLRTQLNEEEEDHVLDVMDFLTGWCSPHLQIKIPESHAPLSLVGHTPSAAGLEAFAG